MGPRGFPSLHLRGYSHAAAASRHLQLDMTATKDNAKPKVPVFSDPKAYAAVLLHDSLLPGPRILDEGEHDAGRFAELGAKMLDFTVSDLLFDYRPMMNAEQIQVRYRKIRLFVYLYRGLTPTERSGTTRATPIG